MNFMKPPFIACRHVHRCGGIAFLLALLASSLCVLLMPGQASAQTCWIATPPSIAFGTVTPAGASSSGTLTFTCNNYTNATLSHRVCLFMNPNTPSGVAPRRMILWSPESYLSYDLYADPAHSQLIGSESSGHAIYSTTLTLTSNGQANATMPLYALLYSGQAASAGSYVSQMTPKIRFVSQSGNTAPSAEQCATSGQASTNYTEVRANFDNACVVTTATDLDFGNVDSLAGNRDQTSAIQLQCPQGTTWRVSLDNGVNANGSTRRMIGPGNAHIIYELYRNSARTQRWGNTLGTDTSNGTGNNTIQPLTVYGRVPAQATPAAGNYSDTVTITLTY